jgi:hypothetical protein
MDQVPKYVKPTLNVNGNITLSELFRRRRLSTFSHVHYYTDFSNNHCLTYEQVVLHLED